MYLSRATYIIFVFNWSVQVTLVVRHYTHKWSMTMTSVVIFSSHGWKVKVKVKVSWCDWLGHLCAACDWLMPLRELYLWLLPVAKQDDTVYWLAQLEKKKTVLKSLCLQDNLRGYIMVLKLLTLRSNHSQCAQKVKRRLIVNLIKREEKFVEHSLSNYVAILTHLHTRQLPFIKE